MKLVRFSVILLFCLFSCLSFAKDSKKRLLFLGDSITAGYGVAKVDSFVGMIKKDFAKTKPNVEVINGGVSGSTSASCVKRIRWQMRAGVDFVVIALGANDGLRGVPTETTYKNLADCIELSRKNNANVILAGMLLPRNYGKKYRTDFEKIFKRLNAKYKPIYFPFLLEGVGGKPEYNQADGIHPNEKGHKIIFNKLHPVLEKEL